MRLATADAELRDRERPDADHRLANSNPDVVTVSGSASAVNPGAGALPAGAPPSDSPQSVGGTAGTSRPRSSRQGPLFWPRSPRHYGLDQSDTLTGIWAGVLRLGLSYGYEGRASLGYLPIPDKVRDKDDSWQLPSSLALSPTRKAVGGHRSLSLDSRRASRRICLGTGVDPGDGGSHPASDVRAEAVAARNGIGVGWARAVDDSAGDSPSSPGQRHPFGTISMTDHRA
jgi:hypothetical protein